MLEASLRQLLEKILSVVSVSLRPGVTKMRVTINLPLTIEQAYVDAAQTKGVSVDVLVTDVLVSHAPGADSLQRPELIEELGVPVLRTGQPLALSVVVGTIDAIRRERDLSALGQC